MRSKLATAHHCARTLIVAVFLVPLAATTAAADVVIDWNARAAKAVLAACIAPGDDPFHESRIYVMMHVAIHDALNAIDRRSRPYAYRAHALPGSSVDAAVAAAARDVLVATLGEISDPFPPSCAAAGIASTEADYAAALAAIPNGAGKTRGLALGRASAAAILARRADDGSDTPLLALGFHQGVEPGEYRDPPDRTFTLIPGWANVRPFVLKRASQFRPGPPYNLHSKKYADDLNEVKAIGGDGITTPSTRTPDQTEIGRFWIESSPLAWNRLTRDVAAGRGLDSWENARLFGLLNLALADGYIASWDTKFHYLFWRPVTAIHEADHDGNSRTAGDPTWTPLQLTYPMPDYDSGHSVEGGAAAQALADFFGTDAIGFLACSYTLPAGSQCTDPSPVLRRFESFSEAADENALSRILIGIHFRDATEVGVRHGRRVGAYVVKESLRPLR